MLAPLAFTASSGFDESLFRALNLAGTNGILDAAMVALTVAGSAALLALLAVPFWLRGRREAAFDLLVLLGVTILVTEALKFAIGRPRPCDALAQVRWIAGYGCDVEFDPAFPSGHASRAFAVAAILGARRRWSAFAAATPFAVLVGLSRIYLGVHWPTDVLAGAVVGIGLAVLLEILSRRSRAYLRLRAWILAAMPHLGSRPAP